MFIFLSTLCGWSKRRCGLTHVRKLYTVIRNVCAMLEPGSGSGIRDREQGYHNKQSHTEEYGGVHERSHDTEEHERIRHITRGAYKNTTTHMNTNVFLQVAYMCAIRPSFYLNTVFTEVFNISSHRQTHTHTTLHTHYTTHTLHYTHATDHSTPAQARGKNYG